MGTRQLRAARLGVLAPPRRGTVFPDGQAEAFGARGYDPGPWLHLADDLSVLRYKDLHRDPLGRPPEHTHGGHLPGQEGEAVSKPGGGSQTASTATLSLSLKDDDWQQQGQPSAWASPGGSSPQGSPFIYIFHSCFLWGVTGTLTSSPTLSQGSCLITLPVWQVGMGWAWAKNRSKLAGTSMSAGGCGLGLGQGTASPGCQLQPRDLAGGGGTCSWACWESWVSKLTACW